MNFSSDSVKLEIRPHKEDFYLDAETPHGHVFVVLDFAPHDYANLTAALKNRLEMIVTSFESSSRFSAEFFLGFVALEINNYLKNLSKQADSPPILCSAALCLVKGNQLSYFLCGEVLLNILTGGELIPLHGAESGDEPNSEQLGARNSQMTLTNQVKSLTLNDSDTVLIMTQGIGKTFDQARLAREVGSSRSSDPKVIRDALLAASAASRNDRTLVVIGGPYAPAAEPTLADLSKAVASLEAKVNTLSQTGLPAAVSPAALKSEEGTRRADDFDAAEATPAGFIDPARFNYRSLIASAALATLVIALVGGFAGSWFQSRTVRKSPELWSVRTSGSQIDIARLDENGPNTVSFALEQPARTTVEQKFSSFTDVKQYLDMISKTAGLQNPPSSTTAATQSPQPTGTVEYSAQPGDSLMSLASRTRVSPDRLRALNPNITRWRSIQVGQKIALPSPSPLDQAASPQGELAASSPNAATNTTEITVGPGDSVMKLARLHNISPEELRKLNPTIARWPLLRMGERIVLPAPTPADQAASAQGEQVSSANIATNKTEITVGPGDSVIKLARRYDVSPEELRKLNPTISRWPLLRLGERITLPSPGAVSSPTSSLSEPSASPANSPVQSPPPTNAYPGTKVVRIGKGESLNSLAQLFNCSPRRIKQLNPRIRNWASIYPGQKIVVPIAPGS